MSLNDWLNSTLGETAPPNFRGAYEQRPQAPIAPSQESREVADIHQRLDAITQQIERISKPAPRQDAAREKDVSREQGVARQLNDAISRLDARLSQISKPQQSLPQRAQPQPPQAPRPAPVETRQRQADAVERAAAQVYRSSPPLNPASFDVAVAEITARQSELDGFSPRQLPPRAAPPIAPTAAPFAMAPPTPAYAPPPPQPGPDFSSLERHLLKITSQIESLQRPDNTEQAINGFRSELAEIRNAITEAMPRRAIESIENEIRSLHRRIDETRSNGTDGQALAGIERALSDIKQVLRTLTPAEQLTGYDEAIRNLGTKLDLILRANDDPSTVRQLEGAISALRGIVSNVASNEALARLSEDVQLLSSKVDQVTRGSGHGDSFAVLEQRIAALTAALETRERPQPSESTEHLESAIRALSDRFDRMQVGSNSASTFAHLEQRVSYLLERIEAASNSRGGNLSRVEDGLHDILRHLERQQATYSALAESRSSAPPSDSGVVDLVKRELSDIRFSQAETTRNTQDSLEAVHNTLGHVVDRLAMIEGDLRAVRTAPPAPRPAADARADGDGCAARAGADGARATVAARAIQIRSEARAAQSGRRAIGTCCFRSRAARIPCRRACRAAADGAAGSAARDQRDPGAAHGACPRRARAGIAAGSSARAGHAAGRTRRHAVGAHCRFRKRDQRNSRRAEGAGVVVELHCSRAPCSAGRCRAAREARARRQGGDRRPRQGQGPGRRLDHHLENPLAAGRRERGRDRARHLQDGDEPARRQQRAAGAAGDGEFQRARAAGAAAGRDQTRRARTGHAVDDLADADRKAIAEQCRADAERRWNGFGRNPARPRSASQPAASSDITGALSGASRARLGTVQVPSSEKLPDGIAGPGLRTAAMKGDASAAYEIGVRFAEGKGVAANYDEAAKWYDRAAQAGVVPATFRLGTLYEKGLGVKKDADIARRYYTQAAERGNAKAMHNLAVLDADGGGRGANYKSAAQWFRKAADRGVADSQFNLGILYARGIGVEQNLAESYKWFTLAAAQGDADAAVKRDDVAKRLDPQSLAAAKLAIQTFSAEPQPDDAVNVAAPAGGWDSAPAQAGAKPAPKPVATKRSASAAH